MECQMQMVAMGAQSSHCTTEKTTAAHQLWSLQRIDDIACCALKLQEKNREQKAASGMFCQLACIGEQRRRLAH